MSLDEHTRQRIRDALSRDDQNLTPSPLAASDRQEGGAHYKQMGVEPWDVVDTWPLEQQIGYYRGGALKYIMRLGHKDHAVQEAKKAGHYIDKLLDVLSKHESR